MVNDIWTNIVGAAIIGAKIIGSVLSKVVRALRTRFTVARIPRVTAADAG